MQKRRNKKVNNGLIKKEKELEYFSILPANN